MGEGGVAAGEFAEGAGSEDGVISGSEVLIDNKSTIVNETVVMNRAENIVINITMTTSNQNTAFDLFLILLTFLLLILSLSITIKLRSFFVINDI